MTSLSVLSRSGFEAFELLSHPVWVFAVDTLRIMASNGAAQSWLGYDEPTLHSMTIADIRPEEDRARLREQIRTFSGISVNAGLWTILSRSGERFSATFSWNRVHFDGTEAIVASISDMTRATETASSLTHELDELRRTLTLSRQHLSSIVDALPGKMAVLTPGDFRIMAVTDDYAQSTMQDRAALMGKRIFDVFPDNPDEPHADGVQNIRASLQRVEKLRVSDVMNIQRYPIRGQDGTFHERFWLPFNKPVVNDEGRLICIIHRVEDVTALLDEVASPTGSATQDDALPVAETRSTLLALQERDLRLRTAERLLNIAAWESDLHWGTLRWSSRVFDMVGVPIENGAPDFETYVSMVHPDDRDAMVTTFREFAEGDAPEIVFQHRVVRDDGAIVHVKGVGARFCVDGREIVTGFVQDISGFKEVEERLHQAMRLQKVAGYMARVGAWRVDLFPERITWSSETFNIYDRDEGKSPTVDEVLDYCIPEHRDRIRAAYDACVQTGQSFDEIRQIVTAKGRYVWVRSIGAAVYDDDNRIIAVEGAFQDITDMIEARIVANDTSRRLSLTLEHISDAFLLLDEEWRCSFLNGQGEVLLQRSRDDLLGRSIWDCYPEAVGSQFQIEYERAVAMKQAVRFQEFFGPLNAWFEVNAYPTPEGLAIYFRDVTQQHAREAHLRLLEAAVERQTDIVLISEAEPIDSPGGPRVVYVNKAFEDQTGYSREDVLGRTPRILQGPKTQRQELDRIREALREWQSVRAELINYTKSGEEFWLELDIAPVADANGVYTHWVAVQRNVTDRKRAEQTIQANEERFRLVAKATGTAIWDWDIAQRRQWWSDGLNEIFGYEPDPDCRIPSVWQLHVHPDDKDRIDMALAGVLAGEQDILLEHYRFRRANGTWANVEDRAFPIRNEQGEVIRIIGSLTDISERLQLEERLRQSQKMEAVGQLTGGVAHDFNNLLTIMLGSAEVLAERLTEFPNLRKLAVVTMEAAEKGAELTSRLLAFSRKQTLEPRVLDIGQLVRGLDGLLRRTLPENIDIEIVRTGGLWKTEIDPGQFESALLNLAINARDAMPDGGSLTIEIVNAVLDEDYAANEPELSPGQYVMVAVTDTGHGIPRSLLNRVFEPFFTTKDVGKGSGLGLSMVFGFVKQSRGHIRVYSELGEGTTFKLYFPRSATQRIETNTRLTTKRMIGGTEAILVVEDNELVCEHVMALLESLGYRAIKATKASEALNILNSTVKVDLLFTDVVMPGGMGGRELADEAIRIRPGLKVLFTSGYTENSIVHNGRLDPGVELISKPYRRDQLALKLRKVLDSTSRRVEGH